MTGRNSAIGSFSEKAPRHGFCRAFISQDICRILQVYTNGRDECNRFVPHDSVLSVCLFVFAGPFFAVQICCALLRKSVFYLEVAVEKQADCQEWAAEELRKKQRETGRLPQKSDFDDETRARIKAFLGPWPRALERAGLKERRENGRSGIPHPRKSRKKQKPSDIGCEKK